MASQGESATTGEKGEKGRGKAVTSHCSKTEGQEIPPACAPIGKGIPVSKSPKWKTTPGIDLSWKRPGKITVAMQP